LSESKNVAQPLEGSFSLEEHRKTNSEGAYVLRALYSDKGTPEIGSLTGSSILILRNPKVQAEEFEFSHNAGKRQIDGSDIAYVSDLENGSYVGFKKIDLTGIENLVFNVASPVPGTFIEIKIDHPEGKKIGEVKLNQSPREDEMKKVEASLSEISGQHDIYFVFRNESEKENIAILDWIEFEMDESGEAKEQ
jgi:cytochrome c